ncbi:uncharacterized protein EV420DRAFT_60285 [Desarmillaria tabescens]|uniref:Uncharacterized protein n=1 Tax=Armillaria tabescens TaxID=1929756 RepID=A0AA39TTJ5_ARMTA|nr:uncharacterized protein EV420DRAFT_60285 [Desarmillaria tabescens]KAK0469737.1 hypothetical protein EV420DRAFT_60285 [Desarmillaria tabescens]
MFKRVDRRLKRKAEDEALGIDGEFKQALGIPDTDSDESDSSSDSSEDEAQAEEVEVEDGSGDDDDEAEVRTVAQILENPLYNSPQDIDMTACFVCPAKLFKGPSMIQIHLQSKHHIRRFSKFKQRSALASPQDDAREHVPSSKDVNESSEGLSNRAKKKNTRRASQAEKRTEAGSLPSAKDKA